MLHSLKIEVIHTDISEEDRFTGGGRANYKSQYTAIVSFTFACIASTTLILLLGGMIF